MSAEGSPSDTRRNGAPRLDGSVEPRWPHGVPSRLDYDVWNSLPFLDRSGSVHAERSKQQGRRLPLFILEMLTSTRRWRVTALFVALTQRTHSQRAMGVMSSQMCWTCAGALARAVARSCVPRAPASSLSPRW